MSKTQRHAFQLKADFLPITVLQITDTDTEVLHSQLQKLTEKAPQFFANAPVLMDFTSLIGNTTPDIEKMCGVLRDHQMQPIAARGIEKNMILPVLSHHPEKSRKTEAKKSAETMVIEKPIRAGTQIYAKDADLLILTSVNAGAEVIADGHIHIYGPLRGRALAGASGNSNARIFCQSLEAELIAIAGHYLVNEKIKTPPTSGTMLQIKLVNNALQIDKL